MSVSVPQPKSSQTAGAHGSHSDPPLAVTGHAVHHVAKVSCCIAPLALLSHALTYCAWCVQVESALDRPALVDTVFDEPLDERVNNI